ncbi:MAG: sensor histidine kinase [Brevundimonas sp.]|uniref:sensor histidine kinase n=1 Tax=Brevundimonas sp. TaxID=1871086 RepID=UPI00391B94CF
MTSPAASTSGPDAAVSAAGAPSLAMWHAGWATACAVLALGGRFVGAGAEGPAALALMIMVAPGLGGLLLLRRDGFRQRVILLTAWSLSAIVAAVLSEGLGGPLAAFVFMPLIAGLALGGVRLGQMGALGTGLAAVGGLAAAAIGAPVGDNAVLAALTGVMTAAAAALALRLSFFTAQMRLERADAGLERYEAILTCQPGLTVVLTPSGRVLAAYGAPPPGLPAHILFEQGLIAAVHGPDRPAVLSGMDKALNGLDAQTRFAPREALDRRVMLALKRMQDGRLIGQMHDATAQYAREAALDAARGEAEARDKGKTRFLAAMSHELRTPLNAVVGFSDIMRQSLFGPLPPKYADYAVSIHEAGGHLLAVINDVLDVSKIEADRYELALERFDARDVLSEAVAMVRLNADEKGVVLTSVLPPAPLTVMADRRALKQITLNLLANAVKFTPAPGSVTLSAEAVGPYLEVVVSDTGVGIAAEDLGRLGRPFEQAGDAGQKKQGTGLGLALVRSLTELHGGRLMVDSTLGEGSAFTARMPVVELAPAVAAEPIH